MVTARLDLEYRIKEIKNSAYMALFGNGILYDVIDSEEDIKEENKLQYWRNLKSKDVGTFANEIHNIFEDKVFNEIYPFHWAHLYFQDNNGAIQGKPRKGIALSFEGRNKDEKLIGEIKAHINSTTFPSPEDECIILSYNVLEQLGYTPSDIEKKKLLVRSKSQKELMKLKVIPVERLPRQVKFILSRSFWRVLDKSNYYYEKLKGCQIVIEPIVSNFDNSKTPRKRQEVTEKEILIFKYKLAEALSFDKKSLNKYIEGPRGTVAPTIFVNFPTEMARKDVIEIKNEIDNSLINQLKSINVTWHLDPNNILNNIKKSEDIYNGAIFYVNDTFMEPATLDEKALFSLQEFMINKSMKVSGDLCAALVENQRDRMHLEKTSRMFWLGVIVTIFIFFIFFYIVLHIRIQRIGVIRMLGVSDFSILCNYFFEGIVFFGAMGLLSFLTHFLGWQFIVYLIIGILASLIAIKLKIDIFSDKQWLLRCFIFLILFISIFTLLHFTILPISPRFDILHFEVLKVMVIICFFAQLGFLIPTFLFLKLLLPAEMMLYRG